MEEYTRNFNKGKERHLTKEYSRLSEQIYKLKAEIESAKDAESAKQLKDKVKNMSGGNSEVLSYNLETLLAEKMQTILARGLANTRMKNFNI